MLAGLLPSGPCGRCLVVSCFAAHRVTPSTGVSVRTRCSDCPGASRSAGLRVDAAIAGELLRVVEPMAIGAAMEAEQRYWRESGGVTGVNTISARLSGRSRSRDLTPPEWIVAFTATTGAALVH